MAKNQGSPADTPVAIGKLVTHENANGGKLWQGKPANHRAAGGRPRQVIKDSVKAVFDQYGVQALEDVLRGVVPLTQACPDCGYESDVKLTQVPKPGDRVSAAKVTADIGGLREKDSYDREVVDMLAAVTSETLRGHGIDDIDDLLAKLSEAWMYELGRHIRGD